MPRPKRLSLTLQTPGTTNVVSSFTATTTTTTQLPVTVTMNGSLTSSGTLSIPTAQKLDFASAGNLGANTFTITGTTELGATGVTSAVTGVATGTVTTTKYFKGVQSISSDAAIGVALNVGISDEAITAPIQINRYNDFGTGLGTDIGGTINYTVQQSMVNPQSGNTMAYANISALAAKTADVQTNILYPFEAIRVIVHSYSAGATFNMDIVQS